MSNVEVERIVARSYTFRDIQTLKIELTLINVLVLLIEIVLTYL